MRDGPLQSHLDDPRLYSFNKDFGGFVYQPDAVDRLHAMVKEGKTTGRLTDDFRLEQAKDNFSNRKKLSNGPSKRAWRDNNSHIGDDEDNYSVQF